MLLVALLLSTSAGEEWLTALPLTPILGVMNVLTDTSVAVTDTNAGDYF